MNPNVDQYLLDGCGRCADYRTPQCKVHFWPEILVELRRIVLECGLEEEYKWSQPCYTYQQQNVLIVTAFKDYACISFFKGALLKDRNGILVKPGKSSQAARQIRFTTIDQVFKSEQVIQAHILEAIEVEKAGLQVEFKKHPEPIPEELQAKLDEDPVFNDAFNSLTPGRQRGYILHFSQPKQAKTRISRIEKWTPKILNGVGMHDAYRTRRK